MESKGEDKRSKIVEAKKRGALETQKIYLSMNYESALRIQQSLREHTNGAGSIHPSPSSRLPHLAYL